MLPSSICGLGHDETSYEPNDTASTATPIQLDEEIRAEVTTGDGRDYYSFEVTPHGQYTLTLSPVDCSGATSLHSLTAELWSGRAQEVGKGSKQFYFTGGGQAWSFSAGSHPHQLLSISGDSSCDYKFHVTEDGP